MIRQATVADLRELTRLFDLYRQFYKQQSDLPSAELFLRERFEKNESIIFVATNDNALVGFTQLYPSFSSVGMKRAWILNDLYVDSAARNSGVGEKLLIAAAKFSKESGASNLVLQTAKSNTTAQKLYENLGWVQDEKYFSYYLFH